ncbi:hypothetical protein FHS96_002035 [Sphingomonas zeicaulis]|uniref:DUF6491 family protein n=1 Tax=Sphingomonas zeicaulis TaxID=1632740 RepID=UPI003D214AED
MRLGWILMATAAAISACGTAQAPVATARSGQQCFYPSQIGGFQPAGDDRAIVRVGFRQAWELSLSPGCPSVDWATSIILRPRGGERVCPGRPVDMLVPEASGRDYRRCLVNDVRRLSSEEMAQAFGTTKE